MISADLRALLGVGPDEPPPYLRKMQFHGYPPGYMGVPSVGGEEPQLEWHTEAGRPPQDAAAGGPVVPLVDFPGLNVPPPAGADPVAWNWRGPITKPMNWRM